MERANWKQDLFIHQMQHIVHSFTMAMAVPRGQNRHSIFAMEIEQLNIELVMSAAIIPPCIMY